MDDFYFVMEFFSFFQELNPAIRYIFFVAASRAKPIKLKPQQKRMPLLSGLEFPTID